MIVDAIDAAPATWGDETDDGEEEDDDGEEEDEYEAAPDAIDLPFPCACGHICGASLACEDCECCPRCCACEAEADEEEEGSIR